MDDDLIGTLENLKGKTIVDVVTGDVESENGFNQIAVFRLDNGKQLTISSHSLLLEEDHLIEADEGLSGMAAVYGDLDHFWEEVEEKQKD